MKARSVRDFSRIMFGAMDRLDTYRAVAVVVSPFYFGVLIDAIDDHYGAGNTAGPRKTLGRMESVGMLSRERSVTQRGCLWTRLPGWEAWHAGIIDLHEWVLLETTMGAINRLNRG